MKRVSIFDDESCGSKSASSSLGSKRRRKLSFSEDEDSKIRGPDSPPMSKIYNSACRNNKPAELFRKDLISAMKLPDSEPLDPNDFWYISDSWKQEWERGVQVPVNSKNVPVPKISDVVRNVELSAFKIPKKFILMYPEDRFPTDTHIVLETPEKSEKVCRYDMDDLDSTWLNVFNDMRAEYGLLPVSEDTFEVLMEDFELQCFNRFQEALQTEEGLGIEYDEDVICDVCRMPECEEGNEMVFCDICNICVHQACYGITAIPEGSWVCRTCAANVQPSCILCPNRGGAMKSTKYVQQGSGDSWAHVSCALWIPEVKVDDPEKMEPISHIASIPASRWALICTFCRERNGACIQCCVKQCKVAYHVTCAFENGLEMNAMFSESHEEDGVRLRSYCLKHSDQSKEVQPDSEGIVWKMKNIVKKEGKPNKISDFDKHNARLQKIREMEAEFYQYVSIENSLQLTPGADRDTVDQIFCYWKLKRTTNFNKPLLPTKFDEAALLGKQPEDSLYARMKMFVHLRQDLERVRNLCYMVSRREKLRRSYFRTKEEVFLKQVRLLDVDPMHPGMKEFEQFTTSCAGNSVIDQMYSVHYKPKKVEEDREHVIEKDKDPDSGKKKLASAARLPNPYAKLYFSDIHTRSRSGNSKTGTAGTYCMRRRNLKKCRSLENVSTDPTAVDMGRKRASISTPVVIRVEAMPEDMASIKQEKLDVIDEPVEEPVVEPAAEEPVVEPAEEPVVEPLDSKVQEPVVEATEEVEEVKRSEKPVDTSLEDLEKLVPPKLESMIPGPGLTLNPEQESSVENQKDLEEAKTDVPVLEDVSIRDKVDEIVVAAPKLEMEQLPLQSIDTIEQERDSHDANKENLSVIPEANVKTSDVIVDESLSDIKNSPSQSDKENVIAHPKVRGRKAKTQHDARSSDLAKAIEELSIEGKAEKKHDKSCDSGDFKNMPSIDGLKTTITRTPRYEMRARKQVLTTPCDEATEPEKQPLVKEQPMPTLKVCDEPPPVIEKMDEDILTHNEDSCENDKEVIELIARDRSTKRRIRLSLKRRTRSKHPPDRVQAIGDSDDSTDEKPCDLPNFGSRGLLFSEHTEYKMSLRQNGKVLLSPVKKPVLENQHRDSLALPLKEAHNEGSKKMKYKRRRGIGEEDFVPVQPDQPHASPTESKQQQQLTPNRDVTSSPRLVIRLVKDPDCKQWQKDTISPNAPTSFKVVRNDWEDVEADSRTNTLKDNNLEFRRKKSIRTHRKNTVKLHRYSMRERKTSSNS